MAVFDVGEQRLAHIPQAHHATDDGHDLRGVTVQAGLHRLEVGDGFGRGVRSLRSMRVRIDADLTESIRLLAPDLLKFGQAQEVARSLKVGEILIEAGPLRLFCHAAARTGSEPRTPEAQSGAS